MKFSLFISLLITLSLFTGCGGGGKDGPTDSGPDFNVNVSSDDCRDSMENVFDKPDFYEDELFSAINFGDAACAKKAIEDGKLNVNIPYKENIIQDEKLPIWKAVERSSLFFAKNKTGAFSVLKVLKEAGAEMNVYNDDNESLLLYVLKHSEPIDHESAVNYLIGVNAVDLSHQDRSNRNALYYILDLKNESILNAFVEEKDRVDINRTGSVRSSSLLQAINNDWERAGLILIDSGALVMSAVVDGNTALHRAVSKSYIKLTKAIGDKMTMDQINMQNSNGKTALHQAVSSRFEAGTKYLIDKGADVNLLDSSGDAVVHSIIGSSFTDTLVKDIINKTSTENLNSNGSRISPLAKSLEQNKIGLFNHILSKPMEISTLSEALFYAQDTATAEKLLSEGAELNTTKGNGHSVASQALIRNEASLFDFYTSQPSFDFTWEDVSSGKNLLHIATEQNKIDVMTNLLDHIDPNKLDKYDQTALFYVKSLTAVDKLIQKDVEINAINRGAKHNAFYNFLLEYPQATGINNYLAVLNRLIESGADTNIIGSNQSPVYFIVFDKNTPLADSFRMELIQMLLATNLDLSLNDIDGDTVLFKTNDFEIVKTLVVDGSRLNKADVNAFNNQGVTVKLHFEEELRKAEVSRLNLQTIIAELNEQLETAGEESELGQEILRRLTEYKIDLDNNSIRVSNITQIIELIDSI